MASRGISSQIALPFALFVVVGSLALVVWMTGRERSESRAEFRTKVETNVRFIARSNLPRSEQLEASLSELLELDVEFAPPEPAIEEGKVVDTGDGREAMEFEIGSGERVRFTRERPSFGQQLFRISTLLPLAAFWGLSLVLATVVSRRLVSPIHLLANSLDNIGAEGDAGATFPGSERHDELGQLSRALSETHGRLIDERRRREEGERAALLGKMATGLAHEIRNPVAAVRMHAQLLEDCERCAGSAKTIIGEAETVGGLVNQWMFLSKPEPPETRRQNVGECLNSCLDALAPVAEHAGVEIEQSISAGVVAAFDASRMGQVFRNLTLNAIHSMPNGGRLKVEVSTERDDAVIRFRDHGCGFSNEALERYGELFFTTKEGGMGVGLSVSQEIVRAHGGTLLVQNNEAGGADVYVRIPIESPPTSA